MPEPLISVVVICHNMQREALRTLHSLSRRYQEGIEDIEYEVLVVDNGSSHPLDERDVQAFGSEFTYRYFDSQSPSPVKALNAAVRASRGRYKVICIDGARILTPGVLRYMSMAIRLSENPVVATLGWHLGDKLQKIAMLEGYDQRVEDELLAGSGWEEDGYALFSISCLSGSSAKGWFRPISESNCIAVSAEMFESVGGFDEAFVTAGGGYSNLDFYKRVCEIQTSELFVLLGEGTFHQFHGGASTNPAPGSNPGKEFSSEYERLRGARYSPPDKAATYIGSLPLQAVRFMRASVETL